jgi:hypothetical protein
MLRSMTSNGFPRTCLGHSPELFIVIPNQSTSNQFSGKRISSRECKHGIDKPESAFPSSAAVLAGMEAVRDRTCKQGKYVCSIGFCTAEKRSQSTKAGVSLKHNYSMPCLCSGLDHAAYASPGLLHAKHLLEKATGYGNCSEESYLEHFIGEMAPIQIDHLQMVSRGQGTK